MWVPGESRLSSSSEDDDERVMRSLREGGAEAAVDLDEPSVDLAAAAAASGAAAIGGDRLRRGPGLAAQLSLTLGSVTEAVGRQWGNISRQVCRLWPNLR